jgi:hypothetical protein
MTEGTALIQIGIPHELAEGSQSPKVTDAERGIG